LVANSGTWLAERLVLLSPHAFLSPPFGAMHGLHDVFRVNLTRQQIENSPPISTHRPVSRQRLEEFHRYHGWPWFWAAGAASGIAGYPVVLPPPDQESGHQQRSVPPDDLHLRSTKAITGYRVDAADGDVGHLRAFIVNDASWKIEHLIVEAGHWFNASKLRILPSNIDRISFEDATVYLKPLKEHLLSSHLGAANAVADEHEISAPRR
jgi:hypothetical protein